MLLLSGCYDELSSNKKLINEKHAVLPIDGAFFILMQIQFEDDDELTEILLQRKNADSHIFRNFSPHPEDNGGEIFFYEISYIFPLFGPDKFIITSPKSSNDKGVWHYHYVERDDERWSFYKSQKDIKFETLEHLSDELNYLHIKNYYDEPFVYFNIEKIDSTRAELFKQLEYQKYEKKQKERRLKTEAEKRKKAAELKRKLESYDQEPTQSEMNAAVRRTIAGQLFNATIKKMGRCRKAGPFDYYCRYQYLGTNWGNFWKQNNIWHFEIAE